MPQQLLPPIRGIDAGQMGSIDFRKTFIKVSAPQSVGVLTGGSPHFGSLVVYVQSKVFTLMQRLDRCGIGYDGNGLWQRWGS